MPERVNFAKPHLHQKFVVEVLTAAMERLHKQTGQDAYLQVFNPLRMPPGSGRFDAEVYLEMNGVELPLTDVLNSIWEGIDDLIEQRAQTICKDRIDTAIAEMGTIVEDLKGNLQTVAEKLGT